MPNKLLGYYSNFPTRIHGIVRYTYQTPTKQLQETILHALHQLNKETHDLSTLTRSSPANCTLNLEFGIAEQNAFNFLDKEELDRFQRSIEKESTEAPRTLDFFCAARYHTTTQNRKRRPLKFDYTLLRFTFYRRTMELFISHERGAQRIPLEDLVTFLTNRINKELTQRQKKTLTLSYLRTL